jgi:6-phosphofructokinase
VVRMPEIKRIGVLTGGGDAPCLNPAVKEPVYRAPEHNLAVVCLYMSALDVQSHYDTERYHLKGIGM